MIHILFNGFYKTSFEILLAISPIVIMFLIMQIFHLKIHKNEVKKILSGFVITFFGLVFFMQGASIAFIPIGTYIGERVGALPYNWIVLPLGFVIGFVAAFAEPAVRVMNKQVDDVTVGAIKSSILLYTVSIGVAIAIFVSMLRILYSIPLVYILIPGYIIIFILSKFVDSTFTAIAFDSGGVVTGPICATFILSFTLGVSNSIETSDPMLDGFGMISLVAMAPIISIMILGFLYKDKKQKA
jgi:hypothetical protein